MPKSGSPASAGSASGQGSSVKPNSRSSAANSSSGVPHASRAEENRTRLVQTVFFDSRGLLGVLYWSIFHWLHTRVFSGLAREIARQAEGI